MQSGACRPTQVSSSRGEAPQRAPKECAGLSCKCFSPLRTWETPPPAPRGDRGSAIAGRTPGPGAFGYHPTYPSSSRRRQTRESREGERGHGRGTSDSHTPQTGRERNGFGTPLAASQGSSSPRSSQPVLHPQYSRRASLHPPAVMTLSDNARDADGGCRRVAGPRAGQVKGGPLPLAPTSAARRIRRLGGRVRRRPRRAGGAAPTIAMHGKQHCGLGAARPLG